MPSSKKQRILRGSDDQYARWDSAAQDQGDSFNSWAADALDAAADWPGETQLHQAASSLGMVKPRESFRGKVEEKRNPPVAGSRSCPARHMKGIKCKLCGKAG